MFCIIEFLWHLPFSSIVLLFLIMSMLYRVLISSEYFFDNLLLKGSFVRQHILVAVIIIHLTLLCMVYVGSKATLICRRNF